MIRAACIQMVSSDNPSENFERAMTLLQDSTIDNSCDLVVFPENFLHFGIKPNQKSLESSAGLIESFKEYAKARSLNIVLGSIPFSVGLNDHRYYSRSLFINNEGEIQARYDKQHLFDVNVGDEHGRYRESDTFCPGQSLVVTPLSSKSGQTAELGLAICYDLRFPEQFLAMRKLGAKVIAVPSAFTAKTGRAHWELLLKARAIDTQCYIIGANQGGVHSHGRETWGHSIIIDPWGRELARCEQGEGVCIADLDLSLLDQIRLDMPIRG